MSATEVARLLGVSPGHVLFNGADVAFGPVGHRAVLGTYETDQESLRDDIDRIAKDFEKAIEQTAPKES